MPPPSRLTLMRLVKYLANPCLGTGTPTIRPSALNPLLWLLTSRSTMKPLRSLVRTSNCTVVPMKTHRPHTNNRFLTSRSPVSRRLRSPSLQCLMGLTNRLLGQISNHILHNHLPPLVSLRHQNLSVRLQSQRLGTLGHQASPFQLSARTPLPERILPPIPSPHSR